MTRRRPSAPPSRREFLDELAARLQALSADELRAAVLTCGEGLPSRERRAFLGVFPEAEPGSRPLRHASGDGTDPGLLDDIGAFIAHLDDADSSREWAWDSEDGDVDRDYDSGLDSAWAEEMDDLFESTARVFVGGGLDLACEAYRRLLHVFLDGHEAFGDAETPEDLLTTDLTEATACYLRALYETLPPGERAARLFDELQQIECVVGAVSLADVSGARRGALPDLDVFLPDWLQRLESSADNWLRYRGRPLLVEAARLHRGADGLADLARSSAARLPEVFLDWVGALVADGREEEAMDACREGLDRFEAGGPGSEVRAEIAGRLAVLGGRLGLAEVALEARREAWWSGPTQRRLLELVAAAGAVGVVQQVIEAEADRSDRCANPRLACTLLLLANRVEPVLARLQEAAPLGWSRSDHPGPVVVPYLLVAAAGSDAPLRRSGSVLGQVFGEMDVRRLSVAGPELDELMALDVDDDAAPGDRPLLSDLLAERVLARRPAGDERERWLSAAQAAIERRTAAVLEAKRRRAYERVARLVVAGAEALALKGGSGAALIAETRSRYPRHVAFRRELDRAAKDSPLLPSSASPPRPRR